MIARLRLTLLLGGWVVAGCALSGCGEPRLIGVTCDEEGCAPRPAKFETCFQRELESGVVPVGGGLEVCYLFTLDGLTSPPGAENVFLSVARADGAPAGHDLDMRMAVTVPLADGRYDDCGAVLSAPVEWVPLMVTVGESDIFNFDFAPIVARRGDRLLVVDTFNDHSAPGPVDARASVRLSCATELPALVSLPIKLGGRQIEGFVRPGQNEPVTATCTFSERANLSRLFRRNRVPASFAVFPPGASRSAPALWVSPFNEDWSHDLEQTADFKPGDKLSWVCDLVNDGDLPLQIPPDAFDTCMLFGFARVPEGSAPPALEGCNDPVRIQLPREPASR